MKSKRHFDKPFLLYHLSEENLDSKTLVPRPLDKMRAMEGEDWRVPRICMSTSIDGAVMSLGNAVYSRPGTLRLWVHVPENLDLLFKANKVHRPSTKQVPDAEATGEHWLKMPATFKTIGLIEVLELDYGHDVAYNWKGLTASLEKYHWRWVHRSDRQWLKAQEMETRQA